MTGKETLSTFRHLTCRDGCRGRNACGACHDVCEHRWRGILWWKRCSVCGVAESFTWGEPYDPDGRLY